MCETFHPTGIASGMTRSPHDSDLPCGVLGLSPGKTLGLMDHGTITLMLSVIALANAKIQLQLAWAVAFILLNIGHWIAAALPRSYNFSFPGYEIEEEYLSVGSRASNFTEALWRAIFLARDVEWVRRSESAPATEVWMNWLAEAERLIKEPPITVQQKDDPHPQRAWKLRRSSTWRMKSGSPRTVHHIPEWSPRESWNRLNGAYQIREAAHQTLSSKV
nr:hypothetical protein CFP56_11990 [Quercus suber]